jgi:ubiquinone/menaquinone biosynthesis C-methylase UbiE
MPVKGHDGKVILDYGCGPGHDLVGFGLYSRPARLIGIDVSAPSLSETRSRLALHGLNAELLQIQPGDAALPFESGTMDYIHCSGVLHHVRNPEGVLKEFRRILKPEGEIRVMVYNKDSIWINLYVAYQKMILEGKYAGMCLADAFSHTTDGEDCPVSRYYTKDEFLQLADKVGLVGRFLGAAISMHEASIFTQLRYQAIQDRRMPSQHREWLLALTVDNTGFPKYEETFAGIDACFSLVKSTGDDFDRIA